MASGGTPFDFSSEILSGFRNRNSLGTQAGIGRTGPDRPAEARLERGVGSRTLRISAQVPMVRHVQRGRAKWE